MEFHFDDDAFRRQVDQVAHHAVAQIGHDLQQLMNKMQVELHGLPLDEAKARLATAWTAHTDGGHITDPHLTQYAEQLRQGGAIKIRTDQ